MDELRCAFFFSTMTPPFQMYSCVTRAYEAVVSGRDHHVVVEEDDCAEGDLQRVDFPAVRLAVLVLLFLLQLGAQACVLHHVVFVLDGHLREVDQSAFELPPAHVLEAEGEELVVGLGQELDVLYFERQRVGEVRRAEDFAGEVVDELDDLGVVFCERDADESFLVSREAEVEHDAAVFERPGLEEGVGHEVPGDELGLLLDGPHADLLAVWGERQDGDFRRGAFGVERVDFEELLAEELVRPVLGQLLAFGRDVQRDEQRACGEDEVVVRGVEEVVPAVKSLPTDDFLEAEDFLGPGVFAVAAFGLLADFADVESGLELFVFVLVEDFLRLDLAVDDVLLLVFVFELHVVELPLDVAPVDGPLEDGLVSERAGEDSVADGLCAGDRAIRDEETGVFDEVQVSSRAAEADEVVDHLEVLLVLFVERRVREVLHGRDVQAGEARDRPFLQPGVQELLVAAVVGVHVVREVELLGSRLLEAVFVVELFVFVEVPDDVVLLFAVAFLVEVLVEDLEVDDDVDAALAEAHEVGAGLAVCLLLVVEVRLDHAVLADAHGREVCLAGRGLLVEESVGLLELVLQLVDLHVAEAAVRPGPSFARTVEVGDGQVAFGDPCAFAGFGVGELDVEHGCVFLLQLHAELLQRVVRSGLAALRLAAVAEAEELDEAVFVADAEQGAFGRELEAGRLGEQRLLLLRGVRVGPEHELQVAACGDEQRVRRVDGEAESAVAVVLGEVLGLALLQLARVAAEDVVGVQTQLGDLLVGLADLEHVRRLLEVAAALAGGRLQVADFGHDGQLFDRAVPRGQQQDGLGDLRLRSRSRSLWFARR